MAEAGWRSFPRNCDVSARDVPVGRLTVAVGQAHEVVAKVVRVLEIEGGEGRVHLAEQDAVRRIPRFVRRGGTGDIVHGTGAALGEARRAVAAHRRSHTDEAGDIFGPLCSLVEDHVAGALALGVHLGITGELDGSGEEMRLFEMQVLRLIKLSCC